MNKYKTITLGNLDKATTQEVFNHIVNHLVTQGVQAMNDHDACKNRVEKGDGTVLKCAAGCLITEAQYYKLKVRECSWGEMIDENGTSDNQRSLIISLQNVHDNMVNTSGEMKGMFTPSNFDGVAKNFKLTPFTV